jgi:predicted MPP superfamily phosphohydrolase
MKAWIMIGVLILYLSGNFYVFWRLWQVMPWQAARGKWGSIVVGMLLASAMFLSFAGAGVLPSWMTRALYVAGTTWLFVFLYLLPATALRDLFLWADGRWWHLTGFPRWASYAVMAGVVAVVLVAGHVRYLAKERVELVAETGKMTGDGLTLVFISDLHLGHGIGARELARWVDMINAEHPDAVLIGGDVVDNDVRPLEEGNMAAHLRRLEAPLGVFACPGNHEYIAGIDRSVRFLTGAGVQVLRDSTVEVGGKFLLVGRDDRSNPRRAPLKKLLEGRQGELPVIVLDHQPVELSATTGVDLQLSGHTHRGQVWPVSWLTDALYEVSHGFRRVGETGVYVTSGIGLWGGKFRIGTRSEYVVIRLR